jgi:CBS domain-containing protein
MTIGELCNREVAIVEPDATVFEAARRMREHHVGDLVVVEERAGHRWPVGILTDRDLVVGVLADDADHIGQLTVGDVMREGVLTANEAQSVNEVVEKMKDHAIRRMPVVDERGALVGIVAFDDLIELIAEELGDLAQLLARQRRRERQERAPLPHRFD